MARCYFSTKSNRGPAFARCSFVRIGSPPSRADFVQRIEPRRPRLQFFSKLTYRFPRDSSRNCSLGSRTEIAFENNFTHSAEKTCIAKEYPYSAQCELAPNTLERARGSLYGGRDNKLSTVSLPAQFPSRAIPQTRRTAKLTLWPLVAATFFMVSGGTYGTEDIIHGAGYGRGILLLLITPILWSLPTAFMIGELSSALPSEGGYYAWVRRAMGNFWGFQEAWLSLVASIFDMAIYPTLFVAYLTRMFPWFQENHRGVAVALGVVIVCAILNIMGVKVVSTTSLWLFFALSAPFAAIFVIAPFKIHALAHAA